MKVTKFGHCCLLIEENGVRFLTDPGYFSHAQNDVKKLDAVLITHEHKDHIHIDSLKIILRNNPGVRVVTNFAVSAMLEKEAILSEVVEDGEGTSIKGVSVEGFGKDHAIVHPFIPIVRNTSYLIGGKFFMTGDAFPEIPKPVEILALPVAGPWMKISEAIDYALLLKPKICFPVHEASLNPPEFLERVPRIILEPRGVPFRALTLNKEYEF